MNNPENGVFGVFDGMGGAEAGEIASRLAMATIEREMINPPYTTLQDAESLARDLLTRAHQKVQEFAATNRRFRGMGTTASLVKIWQGENGERKAVVGNVGDSRVYIARADGSSEQITTDDNQKVLKRLIAGLTDEDIARIAPQLSEVNTRGELVTLGRKAEAMFDKRNYMDQALGIDNLAIRVKTVDIKAGDRIIITTDGVHDNLTNSEIVDIVRATESVGEIASNLVKAAKKRSDALHLRAKPDDTTAVVVGI